MLTPATIDLLLVTIFEGISVLAKLSKGEEISKDDLKIETWEDTVARVKAELNKTI